jgi:hypothetical protein
VHAASDYFVFRSLEQFGRAINLGFLALEHFRDSQLPEDFSDSAPETLRDATRLAYARKLLVELAHKNPLPFVLELKNPIGQKITVGCLIWDIEFLSKSFIHCYGIFRSDSEFINTLPSKNEYWLESVRGPIHNNVLLTKWQW